MEMFLLILQRNRLILVSQQSKGKDAVLAAASILSDSHIDACHAHTFNQFANVYVSIVCRDKPQYCFQRCFSSI